MINLLLYIKDKVSLVWSIIEWINAGLFKMLYYSNLESILIKSIHKDLTRNYQIRLLTKSDIDLLSKLIKDQESEQLRYFEPHSFDNKSLGKIFHNPSLFLMGVFFDTRLVGYFFLRCFVNKKCFVGRLVDKDFRGKGIGKTMNEILYNTSWDSGFRCYATISKNNQLVMKAHINNDKMVIRKQLADDHLLVEFIKV